MDKKKRPHVNRWNSGWLISYTFWYLLIAIGVYIVFTLDGKTLIWANDGLRQVYNTISYISAHVRSFFATGHFTFDMMDFQLGQGMDTLACMCFYGLTDPVNLLSALATGDSMETMYAILIGVRVYLAGAALGLYLRYTFRTEGWATSSAAVLYAVSGYLIYAAVRHPHFVNGALYLPLILYGVEKLLRDRKPHAFVGFSALMLVTNFFFAYINTVIAVFYIIMRIAFRYRARRLRGSAADGFALLGSYILGMAVSAAVFIPITYQYLQNGRALIQTGYTDSLLFYPMGHYISLFGSIVQPGGTAGTWAVIGYTPISLFCAALLLLKRGKSRTDAQILIGISALLFFLMVPFFGKMFNGFGYVTNRWSYALSLPICVACAVMLPALATIGKKQLAALGVFWGAYLTVAIVLAFITKTMRHFATGYAAMIVCFSALLLVRVMKVTSKFMFQALIALIAFAYAFFVYSPGLRNYAMQFNDRGVYARIMNDNLAALKLVDDDGVYRSTEVHINDPLSDLVGYMPVSYYWSIVPAWTAEYQRNVMLSSRSAFHNVRGLDGRTTLSSLAGLKYIVRPKGDYSLLPYGSYPVAETDAAVVYRNPHALPFGYAFTRSISEEALKNLTPVDRELAYARYAVLENASASGVPEGTYESALEELKWTLEPVRNLTLEENRIVTKENGRMRMNFEAPAGYDIFLLIDGVVTDRKNSAKPTVLEYASGETTGYGFLTTAASTVCYGQTGVLLDLGCTDKARDGADLLFWKAAKISYDSIHVYAVPIENVIDPLEALATHQLTNIETSSNRISGDIALNEPAILQISVQYGDGWSATVDGEGADVFRSGGMYTGVRLNLGNHTVVFTYQTPFLSQGLIFTGAGVLTWISLAIWLKRRSRKRA